MKQLIFFAVAIILASAAQAITVDFTITANGINSITVPVETINQTCAFNNETGIDECSNQTIISNQESFEKWSQDQPVELDCDVSCSYRIPKFEAPSTAAIKNYTLDYEKKTSYSISFKSTNTSFTKNPDDKVQISVKANNAGYLQIEKITAKNLTIGLNQMGILVKNTNTEAMSVVNAQISGSGIATASSSTVQTLAPGETDYIFLTLNATEPGTKDVIIKLIAETKSQKISVNFLDKFSVSGVAQQTPPAEAANLTLLTMQINQSKELLKTYEEQYIDKKSQGYLVSEVYDSIKDVRSNLQNAQVALADNNLKSAQKYILLAQSGLDDVKTSLENSKKVQKTFADRIKENALLITTSVAALVAILGLLERQRARMQRIKEKLRLRQEAESARNKKPKKHVPEEHKEKQ